MPKWLLCNACLKKLKKACPLYKEQVGSIRNQTIEKALEPFKNWYMHECSPYASRIDTCIVVKI